MFENQNTAVKKVPVRIVHSEGVTEKENCPFLRHTDSPVAEAESPDVTRLGSLGSSAFTRQREPDSAPAPQTDPKPPRDPYMTTVRDHNTSNSQQPPQPTEEPGSNRGLSEDQKREELARDIMGKDKSLADILDQSKMKTTMDLMEGIFPQGEQLLEEAHQRRKVPVKQTATRSTEERSASIFSFCTRLKRGPAANISDLLEVLTFVSHCLKTHLIFKFSQLVKPLESTHSCKKNVQIHSWKKKLSSTMCVGDMRWN